MSYLNPNIWTDHKSQLKFYSILCFQANKHWQIVWCSCPWFSQPYLLTCNGRLCNLNLLRRKVNRKCGKREKRSISSFSQHQVGFCYNPKLSVFSYCFPLLLVSSVAILLQKWLKKFILVLSPFLLIHQVIVWGF